MLAVPVKEGECGRTVTGYTDNRDALTKRVNRLEGQVRGSDA
jgi:hypothetical protein